MLATLFTATSSSIYSGSQSWANDTFTNLYPLLLWTIGTGAAVAILLFLMDVLMDAFESLKDWAIYSFHFKNHGNPLIRYRQTLDNDVPMLNLSGRQVKIDRDTGQRNSAKRIVNLSGRTHRRIPVHE